MEREDNWVYVYKNGQYYGRSMTDGTVTITEAINAIHANWDIDRLEAIEDDRINRSLDY